MWGVVPDDYEELPAKSRCLMEALVELDASTNQYGIPLDQARDVELGWDVKFVPDYTAEAVENEAKSQFGDKGVPRHMRPVVTINAKSLERKRRALGDEAPGRERSA